MTVNCILAGVGGQGTVLASKLIAQAAMAKGLNARTAETIGMAQRGGCVVSHVRIGAEIHSPMVARRSADVIIGFEPAEAVRCLPYLKPDGAVVVNSRAIMPVTASLGGSGYDGAAMIGFLREQPFRLIVVDGDKICGACGSARVLNVALLGAACAAGVLGLSAGELETAVRARVSPRFVDINIQALGAGAQAATSSKEN